MTSEPASEIMATRSQVVNIKTCPKTCPTDYKIHFNHNIERSIDREPFVQSRESVLVPNIFSILYTYSGVPKVELYAMLTPLSFCRK